VNESSSIEARPRAVEELVRSEIALRGPISFARFMELSLYHPDGGYYEQAREQIGKRGSFYTSVSVGSVFGELLAFAFSAELAELGSGRLCMVEGGAHDGQLAGDILGWLRDWRPGLFARVEYCILEPSPRRRALQQQRLRPFGDRVKWHRGWEQVGRGAVRGVIFANEMLDALPVHRLGWNARERHWFEWGVAIEEGRFTWVRLPCLASGGHAAADCAEDRTEDWLRAAPVPPAGLERVLPDGFTIDFCPAARRWWHAAARALLAGSLLTLDYGLTTAEVFSAARGRGTLRAYQRHTVSRRLLESPGTRDLTAHVNFSDLMETGEAAGLRTAVLVSQETFLLGIMSATERQAETFPLWTVPRRRQLQTLVHPEHLGRSFRVLRQYRRPQAAVRTTERDASLFCRHR
jgi:SAM-dependent MidA family methyltransferase